MTQFKITLRGSVETGEGEISQGDFNRFAALCKENPILAADMAQDWLNRAMSLYQRALLAMQEDFTATRAAKAAQPEGPVQ